MGSCLSQQPEVDFDGPVQFNHFQILRAIGKGAFGKVCIVKKKDTKQMYALKYMNKVQMIHKHAVDNVFREIKILHVLEHAFLVNLWFTFHDREDIFMVLDLMLGGDISYHLEKAGKFSVERVRLYLAELALVLEYLCSRKIIHRDIKPANMLLDSQGHVHLTDFNVATIVRPQHIISSTTGTKPYMAPEVVQSPDRGYSYAVDWWSLGVSAYEMLRGHRPFSIEKNMSSSAIHTLLTHTWPSASANWDKNTCDILKMLLHPDKDKRLQTTDKMKAHPFFQDLIWMDVEQKKVTPSFTPPQNRINCDPTHELEEMIVEPNPLHKKQHRLSKRNYRTENDLVEKELSKINEKFVVYNRQKETAKESIAVTNLETIEESTAKRSLEVSGESAERTDEALVRSHKGSVGSANEACRTSQDIGAQVTDECLATSDITWKAESINEMFVGDRGDGGCVKMFEEDRGEEICMRGEFEEDRGDGSNMREMPGEDVGESEMSREDAGDGSNVREIFGEDAGGVSNVREMPGEDAGEREMSGEDAGDGSNVREISREDAGDVREMPGEDAGDGNNVWEMSGEDAGDGRNVREMPGEDTGDGSNVGDMSGEDRRDGENVREMAGCVSLDGDVLVAEVEAGVGEEEVENGAARMKQKEKDDAEMVREHCVEGEEKRESVEGVASINDLHSEL